MGLYSKLIPASVRNALRPLKDPAGALLSAMLRSKSGNRVISGPFAGMAFRYPQQEYAMLLGTWEMELSWVWEEILASTYPLMVDVGAAEGYYAVGMAYRKPGMKVLAFEMQTRVREKLRTLQRLNGTSVEIREKCEVEDLAALGDDLAGAFVLMDVEGYETVLLDPVSIPRLAKATILVELHEMYAKGCRDLIKERFLHTHDIRLIEGVQRTFDHFPAEAGMARKLFSKARLLGYMDEGRPCAMSWFYMVPKEGEA